MSAYFKEVGSGLRKNFEILKVFLPQPRPIQLADGGRANKPVQAFKKKSEKACQASEGFNKR
jgi:hypothetical protein